MPGVCQVYLPPNSTCKSPGILSPTWWHTSRGAKTRPQPEPRSSQKHPPSLHESRPRRAPVTVTTLSQPGQISLHQHEQQRYKGGGERGRGGPDTLAQRSDSGTLQHGTEKKKRIKKCINKKEDGSSFCLLSCGFCMVPGRWAGPTCKRTGKKKKKRRKTPHLDLCPNGAHSSNYKAQIPDQALR